jgi:pyruvate,orthophosphate dikinase
MILADNLEDRQKALDKLLPMQKGDFVGIFTAMAPYPVTVRLLDPPLHEFLPHGEKDRKELSSRINVDLEKLKTRVNELFEFNPMLGHRGCRLGVTYPEIYGMQARAIAEAAAEVTKAGNTLDVEIMIPLVGTKKELSLMRMVTVEQVEAVKKATGVNFKYLVGTMIELPRAALTADQIAEDADFFSFGTNDLTQTALGVSRDDAGRFLGQYVEKGIFEKDPFVSIDQEGVGLLVQMGVEKGRKTRNDLKVGVCGEHGGDPKSVAFFHKAGLNYVSCSPFRVPIARLAAAHAACQK